jgi:aryl-alcohol dehydrogenase-like predicted oxidoreductase
MELRELGQTGYNVSVIGLGTVKFGRNSGVNYPIDFDLPGDRQIVELFSAAREQGINFLDTAPAYGLAEERIGTLLPDPRGWIIATKVGEIFENGVSAFDFSAAAIRRSVERSCRLLRRDYLDLVLVHSDGRDLDIIENSDAFQTLRELKQLGDIAAFGLSGKTVAGGLAALEQSDAVMVTLNADDQSQLPVIEAAAAANKGVLIKKAFDSGHLADPATLTDIAQTPGVHSIVVGTLNPDHLAANCRAVDPG